MWYLNQTDSQPALFRISMFGGGSSSTYVDNIALFYLDQMGDVNGDGEVNIADVNAILDMILNNTATATGDVNSDTEVNIADVNTLIDIILAG